MSWVSGFFSAPHGKKSRRPSWPVGCNSSLILLALLPASAWARPPCPPALSEHEEYFLAVQSADSCILVRPNEEVQVAMPKSEVEAHWLVPKCFGCPPQVVFARTAYRDDQPLALYRNRGLSDFFRTDAWKRIPLRTLTAKNYIAYHLEDRAELPEDARADIEDWEDCPFFPLARSPRAYVTDLLRQLRQIGTGPLPGTERLISLRPLRSRPSWVRIVSEPPPRASGKLTFVLAYSENQTLRTYTLIRKDGVSVGMR